MIERIDAVDVDDVRALAAELFAPERLSVAGDRPDEERASGARARRRSRRRAERAMIRVGVAGAAGRMGADGLRGGRRRRGHGARRARRPAARGRARGAPRATPTWSSTSRAPTPRSRTRSPACGGRARGHRHDRLRPGAAAERALAGRRERAANVLVAPNFAIGAVLMMRFAAEAARAHGEGRDHRAAPRPQARRAQRHGGAHGAS